MSICYDHVTNSINILVYEEIKTQPKQYWINYETYLRGSKSMVLCFIMAVIFSSSVPFIMVKSIFPACESVFFRSRADADAAAFSAVGSHAFFVERVANGTRAIINDVFFGIKHESSTNSIRFVEKQTYRETNFNYLFL